MMFGGLIVAADMTHGERVRATLRGQEVDRPAVSMWRHHFADERTPEGLAETTLAFQREFDWDFIKVNPRATYHAESFGMAFRPLDDDHPEVIEPFVNTPSDWRRVEAQQLDNPVLADHLNALDSIVRGAADDTPVLMTVFNPVSIAARFAPSGRTFGQHLREHFDEVGPALDAIADTFSRFGKACVDRGAAGLFFATTAWATRKRLTEDEYAEFARPYDLRVLDAVSDAWFNLLHVCQDRNMLAALADYPAHAFNWDVRGDENPSLTDGQRLVGDRPIIGGIPHESALVDATPVEVASWVAGVKENLGPARWMIGPGCTFDPAVPKENLRALRDAVV